MRWVVFVDNVFWGPSQWIWGLWGRDIVETDLDAAVACLDAIDCYDGCRPRAIHRVEG